MAAGSGWTSRLLPGDPSSAFPSPNDEAECSEAESPAAPRLVVLLVEDNQTDVIVIKEVLKACGLEIRLELAADGERALAMLGISGGAEQELPGLVLLDLNLPKISGIEVLSRIRESPRCRNLPVVIVTSSESEGDRRAVQALNATAYFRKPTSVSAFMDLGNVIKSVLPGRTGSTDT